MTIGNSKLVILCAELKKTNIKLCRQLGLQTRNLKQDDINTAVGKRRSSRAKNGRYNGECESSDGYNIRTYYFSGLSDEILINFCMKAELNR